MTFFAVALGLLITLLVAELVAYFLISSLGYVATREFPNVPAGLVEKFTSFDDELGHLPLPNTVTFDRDITGKTYSSKCSYNSDRARNSLFGSDEPALISTFGDSFCQCRGVEDECTWQRRLEEKLGRPVRNYGVGGHGLDQAHLRYLRLRTKPLGRIVIFAVSPCTIERVVGVYKHYIEFGNVLGLKPRYRLKEGGGLELVKLPFKDVFDLQRLSDYKEFIRERDENFLGYFRKHSARLPFCLFLLRHRSDFSLAATKVLVSYRKLPHEVRTWAEKRQNTNAEIARQSAYHRKNSYFRLLYSEHQKLFFELTRKVTDDCKVDGRQAVLLFLPDYTNIKFMKSDGVYYRKILDRIRESLEIKVIDSYQTFINADPKLTYLKDNFSGHHTALGNLMISDLVLESLDPLLKSALLEARA